MAERSEDEYPLSNPTVIEGASIDNEEEFVPGPHSWAPSGSGPMGIPRSSSQNSPQSAASSYLSNSRFAPHTFGPSSVSSSYSRHTGSNMPTAPVPVAGVSGPSRSFKARAKRDLPRESPSSRRSILSSLLQQQGQGSTPGLPTFTSSRSRRQSTNSFASDSDCSPSVGAMHGPPDWRPPFPSSASYSHSTASVSRTHVSTSSRARYGPAAAPKSIMPCIHSLKSSSQTSIDIVNHDVPDMLKMIASVLKHILNTNDALYTPDARGNPLQAPPVKSDEGTQMRSTLLSFHGCIIPAISQRAYLNRILKYCPLTNEVFLASLIYFDRISHYAHQLTVHGVSPASPGTAPALFILDSYNVHRLIIAAVTVASKFFSDIFYKNSRYAQVGGLPVDELNNLELQLLIILKFNLMITVEEFQAYADYVQDFYAQYGDDLDS